MSTAYLAPQATARSPEIGVFRKIFSLPVAIAGLLVTLATLTVRSRFDDPDMWWHLKLGEATWSSHRVPTTDLFSYTTNHHAYVAHEWLSQVLLYGAYRFAGYRGLMLWECFFTAALLIAGYALCTLYSRNAKVALLGALTIWLFGTIGFAVRPQMIGYLLLIIELLLLELGRTRNPRWFLALPPLFALWVNCHGSWSLGILVAALLLSTSWFDFQYGSLSTMRWEPGRRRALAAALLLSVAALFCNPIGVRLILYPLQTMLHSPVNLGAVQEWRPLRLDDSRGLAFLGVLACVALLAIARKGKIYLHELLWLILVAVEAARYERLIFAFGIVAAPILCRLLSTSWEGYDSARDHPLANAMLIAASLLVVCLAFPSSRNLAAQVEQHSPVRAVEFIHASHLSGPMLNDYASGGYLIWAAPELPVFIDGRADIFEQTGVLEEYGRWATLRSSPTSLLDKYRINFCLLARDAPMASVLPRLSNWRAAYSDDSYAIFVRTQIESPGHPGH